MADYKRTNRLATSEAAYVAGLIDGEGTISLSRKHKKDQRQLVVTISNNERQSLSYVRNLLGAGFVTNKKVYSEQHAPMAPTKLPTGSRLICCAKWRLT